MAPVVGSTTFPESASKYHKLIGPHLQPGEEEQQFQAVISRDERSRHPAVPGRYILLASRANPDSHQVLLVHKLKNLDNVIEVVLADNVITSKGWMFPEGTNLPQTSLNDLYGATTSKQTAVKTLPAIYDKEAKAIINNNAEMIIKMMVTEFDTPEGSPYSGLDLYPPDQREIIDKKLTWILESIAMPIYVCGFATKQVVYDQACMAIFDCLGQIENRLQGQKFLCRIPQITLADIALFSVLIRLDPVYYSLFKINLYRVTEMPAILEYMKFIYQMEGIAETIDFDAIKEHYMKSYDVVNQNMIVAAGPAMGYLEDPSKLSIETS